MWHCPHCGAPQAETARCWVCHRSSTTCSTCRHFRTSLAADVGYCGLDRHRRPLTGLEQRGCWAERPVAAQAPAPEPRTSKGGERVPARTFIPIEDVQLRALPEPVRATPASKPAAAFLLGDPIEPRETIESLFGDLDR
jgi:hypothetical protein